VVALVRGASGGQRGKERAGLIVSDCLVVV
jgi:hypothetical protein